MRKKKNNITAYSEKAEKYVDLQFNSIKEARTRNPYLKNFRLIK